MIIKIIFKLSWILLAISITPRGLVSANALLEFIWTDDAVLTCKSHEDLTKLIPLMAGMEGIEKAGLGMSLSDKKMTPNMNDRVSTGQQSFLKLSANENSGFNGFFIRISSTTASDSVDLTEHVIASTPNIQTIPSGDFELDGNSPTCKPGVVGLSHNDSELKYGVEAFFDFPKEPITLTIEVTVNRASSSNPLGEWYFSSYNLVVANEEDFTALGGVETEGSEEVFETETFGEGFETETSGEGASSGTTVGEHEDEDGCRWWCKKIPLPWYASENDEISKCDHYTFSCGKCADCTQDGRK